MYGFSSPPLNKTIKLDAFSHVVFFFFYCKVQCYLISDNFILIQMHSQTPSSWSTTLVGVKKLSLIWYQVLIQRANISENIKSVTGQNESILLARTFKKASNRYKSGKNCRLNTHIPIMSFKNCQGMANLVSSLNNHFPSPTL